MTRRNVLKGAKLNLCHAVLAVAVTSCLAPIAAHAQSMETQATFNIPAGDLASAIDEFSRQSGLQILYKPELVAGKRVAAITGSVSNKEVLTRLLKGAGVRWERVDDRTFVLRQELTSPAGRKTEVAAPDEGPAAKVNGDVQELEELVVVGSRLGTSPVESAMPIKVISREQIDKSGAGNIAQVLSYLSEVSLNNSGDRPISSADGIGGGGNTNSTTIQLRGLAKGTVLVLINGRRAGSAASYSDIGQFDLSTVPLSLVDRIEVLPAGSSAVYGGDGLAGVINIVLRRDANGVELRHRQMSADGYGTRQATIMLGSSWTRGSLSLAATWSDEEDLMANERQLTADQDFRRFGGRDYRTSWSNPANVFSLEGCESQVDYCFVPIDERGNLPGLSSPYAVVPQDTGGARLTPSDFLATQGMVNKSATARHLRSAEKNLGVTTNGAFHISKAVELFFEAAYTKRDVPAYEVPLFASSAEYSEPISIVPATNPFNPFGVPVAVGYRFNTTGVFTLYSQNHNRGTLGLRGNSGRFSWELALSRSEDKSGTSGGSGFSADSVLAALNATDTAIALNPFTSNGAPPASPEVMRQLAIVAKSEARNETETLTGFARGRVVKIPAGEVTALIGFELIQNEFDYKTNSSSSTIGSISGERDNRAAFAEVRVPLVSPLQSESIERVALTGAYRRETSDGFEAAANTSTVGLEARVTPNMLLRATYSTAFRPILAYYDFQDPRYRVQVLTDPLFGNSPFVVDVRTGGGHPSELAPEESQSKTAGFIYRPDPKLSIGATYWETEILNRITYIAAQDIVDNETSYTGRVLRDPDSGLIKEVDARQVNIARMKSSGIDLDVGSYWPTSFGDIQAQIAATYVLSHDEQQTPESPVIDGVARHRLLSWAPRWKIVPRFVWDVRGHATTTVAGRYISAYKDSLPFAEGANAGEYQHLGDFWLVDINIDVPLRPLFEGFKFMSGAHLNFGANNVFNRRPEFCAGCGAAGYDSTQYDIVGRALYAELRVSF